MTVRSIFIVHGLNGGAASTWQHPKSKAIWFRDFLPGDLRDEGDGTDARIWTYGYPAIASWSKKTCNLNPEQFAQDLLSRVEYVRRGREVWWLSLVMLLQQCISRVIDYEDQEAHKIIWVCHSLGGIVVKKVSLQIAIIVIILPLNLSQRLLYLRTEIRTTEVYGHRQSV